MLLNSTAKGPEKPWKFVFALTDSGKNIFEKWDAKISKKARARRNTHMKYLRFQSEANWTRPNASHIKKQLYVIRFNDENDTQHRLYGYFDKSNHAFVICHPGYEKDSQYFPTDYEDRTADTRTRLLASFDEHTAPCNWDSE